MLFEKRLISAEFATQTTEPGASSQEHEPRTKSSVTLFMLWELLLADTHASEWTPKARRFQCSSFHQSRWLLRKERCFLKLGTIKVQTQGKKQLGFQSCLRTSS